MERASHSTQSAALKRRRSEHLSATGRLPLFNGNRFPHAAHLIASRFPARRHDIVETIKALPCRLDGRDARMRDINRGFIECHGRNVARAIWKDDVGFDANDQLRADRLGEQGIITINSGLAIDS